MAGFARLFLSGKRGSAAPERASPAYFFSFFFLFRAASPPFPRGFAAPDLPGQRGFAAPRTTMHSLPFSHQSPTPKSSDNSMCRRSFIQAMRHRRRVKEVVRKTNGTLYP